MVKLDNANLMLPREEGLSKELQNVPVLGTNKTTNKETKVSNLWIQDV